MLSQHNIAKVTFFFKFLNNLKLSDYKMNHIKASNFLLKHKITNPAGRTERKRRTTGSSIYNDSASFWNDSPARKKIDKRAKEGLCIGCGNKPAECRCKRKGK